MLLLLHGAEVAQRRMQTRVVVEGHPVQDGGLGLLTGGKPWSQYSSHLQMTPEALNPLKKEVLFGARFPWSAPAPLGEDVGHMHGLHRGYAASFVSVHRLLSFRESVADS